MSGDHFYAHVDETALDGTIFERRVAHGYWVLSKAAGMFVEPHKGPVLLNYGLESCRFTKPVYPGMTIGVKLTVEEKVQQEKRGEDDVLKGIVKFKVDVTDETGETVAIATILTMVKNRRSLNDSAPGKSARPRCSLGVFGPEPDGLGPDERGYARPTVGRCGTLGLCSGSKNG